MRASSVVTWQLALATAIAVRVRNQAFSSSKFGVVQTETGDVVGHRSLHDPEVWEYLGIPYAQPPLGVLRFAAPQKIASQQGLYEATDFGYDCPQVADPQPNFPGLYAHAPAVLDAFSAASGTPRSEDCLTLNIWSRETRKSYLSEKPVLVFFYGGRFAAGNTDTPFANGQYLASSEDIIFVSVNYRVNIFGFPGAPDTDTNIGLKDQRLAVEWIQANIKGFGGSPTKITIAGQSAGGVAVDYWSYAYTESPIVHGLLSLSGNALSFPVNPVEVQASNWLAVATTLGCSKMSSSDTLQCMRSKAWEDISTAASKVRPGFSGSPVRSTPPFYPTVDDEVIFSPTEYLNRSKSGKFARLPYFHGHTDFEQGFYVIPAFAKGRNITKVEASEFLLASFVCPVSHAARSRTEVDVPTWVYRFFGDWNNTRLYPTSGAYHGTDLHMLLGGSVDTSHLPQSREQEKTVALFQKAVAAFTDDPMNGLQELGWPQFHPEEDSWIEIAVDNRASISFARPSKYDELCDGMTLGALGIRI